MNWTKLLYVLIIVLLYVPMVFLGANVFFPKYTGLNSFYNEPDCYGKYPQPVAANENVSNAIMQRQQACMQNYTANQKTFEQEKNTYDGKKYTFIALFNLILLLAALFIPMQDSIVLGLFLGSVISTFAATIGYFQSNSKIGFVVLVVIFIVTLFFINRKKDSFVDWKSRLEK